MTEKIYQFERSIDAVWETSDYDIPVKLKGYCEYEDEYYFFVEGSKTGIPSHQISITENNFQILLREMA